LVNALGIIPTEALTPIFFFTAVSTGVPALEESPLDFGVGSTASPSSSSSSTPNDNFGVPILRFFFLICCSLGVDALCYGR